MAKKSSKTRAEGMIRRRKNSFQAVLYAGIDPVTGRELYLRGSSTDEREAERMLRSFQVQVAEQRHAKTRASMRTTIDAWLATNELEASTRENYAWLIAKHIDPVLGGEPIAKVTAYILERFYAELRRCSSRCNGRPFVEHRIDGSHECRTVRHKRPPGRPPKAGYPPHDCEEKGCVVIKCPPHVCEPLGAATVRKVHFVIRGSLAAAMRWGWISANPAELARIPRPPAPDPDPPTPAEAAVLVAAARAEDPAWGTLVWVVMVTGLRRAELLALRWTDVDFDNATLYVTFESRAGTSRRTPRRIGPVDSRSTRRQSGSCVSIANATTSDAATSASSRRRAPTCSRTRRRTTDRATRAGSRTGTGGCAPESRSTATCTRYATIRRPNFCRRAWICGPSPDVSVTEAGERRRSGCTRRGSRTAIAVLPGSF